MKSVVQTRRDPSVRTDAIIAGTTILALLATGWGIHLEMSRPARIGSTDKTPIARASRLVGSARRRLVTSLVWQTLEPGQALWRGDGVFVPDNGALDLKFYDGSRLSVGENSLVVIDLPADGTARAQVRSGNVAAQGGTSGLQVCLDSSRVEITRGAMANVVGNRAGDVQVTVERGEAVVHGSRGEPVRLAENYATTIREGVVTGASSLPVKLHEPAASATIYTTKATANIQFSWSAPQRLFVLEVASEVAFTTTVFHRNSHQNRVTLQNLTEGVYYWRVREPGGAIASPTRSLRVVRDLPPSPINPSQGALVYQVRGKPVAFWWTAVIGVRRYRVQVAHDALFLRVTFSRDVDVPQLLFSQRLPEGDYYWRVRSLAPERGDSPFCPPISFKVAVEPLPRAPHLIGSEIEVIDEAPKKEDSGSDEGSWLWPQWIIGDQAHAASSSPSAVIILRWEPVAGVDHYVLQIAADKSFHRVVIEEKVQQSYFRWKNVSKREYWWRVKSVDRRGRAGVFSPPRKVGAVLASPALKSPEPGASFLIETTMPSIAFTWEGQRLAADHEWVIASDAAFRRVLHRQRIRGTTFRWSPPAAGSFFWRVRACDASGSFAPFASSRRLDVRLAAPQPAKASDLTMPFSDPPAAVLLAASRVLTATAYDLQVASSAGFRQPVWTTRAKKPRGSFLPPKPGSYAWRIRAVAGGGVVSHWSSARPISVTLAVPTIIKPAPRAKIDFRAAQSETVIAWKPVPGAMSYRVIIKSGDERVAVHETRDAHAAVAGLGQGTYTVSVLAQSGELSSRASTPISFSRVALPPLAVPELIAPPAGARLLTRTRSVSVGLRWKAVVEAASYEVEIASDDSNWRRNATDTTGADLAAVPLGTHRWRVRALDRQGIAGPFSAPRDFSVIAPQPGAAAVTISPTPIVVGETDVARIDIQLEDEMGESLAGADLAAAVERGVVSEPTDEGQGRYLARYAPPERGGANDTLLLTVAQSDFRSEHTIDLRSGASPLYIGSSAGLIINFSETIKPTVDLEAGLRLPVWTGRLLAVLRLGYHFARLAEDDPVRASASQHAVPVAAGIKLEFPYWRVVPYGCINLLAGVLVGRVKVKGQPAITRTRAAFGGEAAAGASLRWGPGAVFAAARLAWLRDRGGIFTLDGGGLAPVVGYRFEP